jgi:hypothetical protein
VIGALAGVVGAWQTLVIGFPDELAALLFIVLLIPASLQCVLSALVVNVIIR